MSVSATATESKLTIETLLTAIYVLHYKARFKPESMNFVHSGNIQTARLEGEKYCDRFGLRFISVVPFFGDINRKPTQAEEQDA